MPQWSWLAYLRGRAFRSVGPVIEKDRRPYHSRGYHGIFMCSVGLGLPFSSGVGCRTETAEPLSTK